MFGVITLEEAATARPSSSAQLQTSQIAQKHDGTEQMATKYSTLEHHMFVLDDDTTQTCQIATLFCNFQNDFRNRLKFKNVIMASDGAPPLCFHLKHKAKNVPKCSSTPGDAT